MENERVSVYEDPGYPVSVNFKERKKEDASNAHWVVMDDDIIIVIVNNGELIINCEGTLYSIRSGQGAVINSAVRHKMTSSSREDTAYYELYFKPDALIAFPKDSNVGKKYAHAVSETERFTIIKLDEANLSDELALDRINSIIVTNTLKKFGYEMITKGHLCMLWAIFNDFVNQKAPSFNAKNLPSQDELRIKSAVAFIRENYHEQLTLEDIAGKIHVSRNECCRAFKRVLMISPVDYLNRYRIFEAARLIYKAPIKVDSIAGLGYSVGFNNPSYFNRMFRRFFECTPREFMKLLKENPERATILYNNLQNSVTEL